jgi:hypothetical protein
MKHILAVSAAVALSAAAAAGPPPVTVKKTADAIEFSTADGLVATYHVPERAAKPYFWPLNAPGGVPVTRGWPIQKGLPNETTDHVHQKSAWFCHGDVIPEGLDLKVRSSDKRVKGVDFWSESPGHGKIVCVSVGDPEPSASTARIATHNEWRAPDGTKILDEVRTIAVRNLGDARLMILDIDLHASVCPITFGDTKEGSMGVRVNDQIRLASNKKDTIKNDGTITSADGSTATVGAKDNLPMWGKRADWHDYSGTVDGKAVGITLFDHPKNAHRAAWHTRAYGLLAANPFGRASFPATKGEERARLAKGEHLKLRYGLLLHSGNAKEAKVAEHYAAFSKE